MTASHHESAHLHVQGAAAYIDDLPLIEGTLHAAPLLSNIAHGRIVSLDLSAVRAAPGVHAVITADDIPATDCWPRLCTMNRCLPSNALNT
jgi:xanthine dehydrogenase large subunit